MKVLVTAASRHGSTLEIASAIEGVLVGAGLETALVVPERVADLAGYDAVILGSAIYAGHWLDPAKEFVSRNLAALLARPVWLFSSGPVGDTGKPPEVPADVARVREATGAREHRLFSGRLARRDLGFAEKAILSLIRVPDGDYRSWTEIEAWAMMIARTLQPQEAVKQASVAAR
jgi:menaquinone-dependent protoporphyrinogen oxidase